MTGGSLGLRTSSYGSLQQQFQNGFLQATQASPVLLRKPSKMLLSSSREKERLLPLICRYVGRRRVAMLLLVVLALLVFVFGSFTVNKGLFLSPFLFFSPLIVSCYDVELELLSLLFIIGKLLVIVYHGLLSSK